MPDDSTVILAAQRFRDAAHELARQFDAVAAAADALSVAADEDKTLGITFSCSIRDAVGEYEELHLGFDGFCGFTIEDWLVEVDDVYALVEAGETRRVTVDA